MRKSLLLSTALCLASFGAHAQSMATPPSQGVSVSSLYFSAGVATHFDYTDGYGMYANYTTITNALSYLGLSQIRDRLPAQSTGANGQYTAASTMERLSQLGYQFDLNLEDYTNPIAYDQAQIDYLFAGTAGTKTGAPMMPGAIRTLEGLNEVSNAGSKVPLATATAWQQQIYCLSVQASFCTANSVDSNVAGAAVAEFTSNGPITPTATPSATFPANYANVHPYTYPNANPQMSVYQFIAANLTEDYKLTTQPALSEAGEPATAPLPTLTEGGAYQEPTQAGVTTDLYLESYDAHTMAIKDLDDVLDAISLGSANARVPVYLYQLFDNYSTNAADQQYGLFTYGGKDSDGNPIATPTIAATAIHNLTTIAKQPGLVYQPSANNCLAHTFTGAGTDFHSFMVQFDNSGDYGIVMWRDTPADWSYSTHSEVALTPEAITINLAYSATGTMFDPMVSASPTSSYGSTTAIPVSLGDDPTIVFVSTSNPGAACN